MWTDILLLLIVVLGANAWFQWEDCAPDNAPMKIKSFNMTDPVHLPGTVKVNASGTTTGRIDDATVVVTLIKRHAFFGIDLTIPCIKNIGSCTYPSLCTLQADFANQSYTGSKGIASAAQGTLTYCTAKHIDCGCPFTTGTLNLTNEQFPLPSVPQELLALEHLASGDYTLEIKLLSKPAGSVLFCGRGNFTLDLHPGGHRVCSGACPVVGRK